MPTRPASPASESHAPSRPPELEDASRDPSLLRMVKNLRDDSLTLVRQEIALAKREMIGKVSGLGRNAVFLAIGAFVGLFGLFFVLLSLNNLLFAGLARVGFSGSVANWLAPVLVGMGLLIVALGVVLKALRSMRKSPIPDKTMETLREDKEWIKGKLR